MESCTHRTEGLRPYDPTDPHYPAATRSAGAPGTPRWVRLLLMLLGAALVAGIAGLLAHAGGASVPNAILTGGTAYAGTIALLLGLAHYLGDPHN